MAGLELDFVMYLGDPDDGADAIESQTLIQDLDRLKEQIDADGPYGALCAKVGGKDALDRRPDPIVPLMTHLLKAVPYVIDGEQESVLLSESEHGVTLAGGSDDVRRQLLRGRRLRARRAASCRRHRCRSWISANRWWAWASACER